MVFVLIFFLVTRTGITLLHRGSHWVSPTPPPPKKIATIKNEINSKRAVDDGKREKVGKRSVGAARKVSCNWLQEAMTCHSSNCFSIVYGQGNAPLVTSLPSSCYMTLSIWGSREKSRRNRTRKETRLESLLANDPLLISIFSEIDFLDPFS